MFGLEAVWALLGWLWPYVAAGVGILVAWWAKGKAGERRGLQKAAETARERERQAYEEVARQRGAPGPEPLGGMQRTTKPLRGPPSSPDGEQS